MEEGGRGVPGVDEGNSTVGVAGEEEEEEDADVDPSADLSFSGASST